MTQLRSYKRDDRGQIAIITGLSLAVVTGVAGLATIFTQSMNAKGAIQASLDAAVLSATAMKVGTSEQKRIAMAKEVFQFNLDEAARKESAEIIVTEKPEFLVNQTEVSGFARGKVRNTLGAALGIKEMDVEAQATAKKMVSEPLCILALNRSSPASIEVYGNAQINAHDCPVQANSSSGEGLKLYGAKSGATASIFGVTGGYSGENWEPKPTTGTEPTDDPYAGLPVPEAGSCKAAGKLNGGNHTLNPGTYCGGLDIGANANVTLNPGIYIMKDGPFAVGAGAAVRGEEVMIALTGANSILYLNAGSSTALTSPMDGVYKNLQIMSDRDLSGSKSNEEWTTIIGGATLAYDGVIYLPEQNIWASGTAHDIIIKGNSPSLAIVADKVWAQGNVVFEITQEDRRGIGEVAAAPGIAWGARLSD